MVSDTFRKTCSGLLALYFLGLGTFLTGFASDHWRASTTANSGLWRSCFRRPSDSTFTCDRMAVDEYPEWMQAVVAFMILALIAAVMGGVTYMFVPFSASCQLICGAFTFIAIAIYAGYQSRNGLLVARDIGWSFALATVGGACFVVNGIVLLVLMSKEEEGFTMEKIMPNENKVKVGTSERYPTHIYHH